MNRVRIVIEHSNARCKTFAAVRNKLKIGSGKMRREFNVLSGFVNCHLAMGVADSENAHRKRKKPGPKTSRNRGR